MSCIPIRASRQSRMVKSGFNQLGHNNSPALALLNRGVIRCNHYLSDQTKQPSKVSPSWFKPSGLVRNYAVLSSDKPALIYTYEDVKKVIDSHDPNVVLVDVREPDELSNGSIPTAINIPYGSSPGALGLDEESFEDAFGFPKPSVDKTLVFFCLAGIRSAQSEVLAATFGYQK